MDLVHPIKFLKELKEITTKVWIIYSKNNNNTFKGLNSGVFMELKPYAQVERHRCPFYGFSAMHTGIMKDSGGNQCALITTSHNLYCRMEIMGDKPRWSGCVFDTKENRTKLAGSLEKIKVFPREFRPPKIKSWKGISLMSWVNYIWDVHKE